MQMVLFQKLLQFLFAPVRQQQKESPFFFQSLS
jgi:hypothetical protein